MLSPSHVLLLGLVVTACKSDLQRERELRACIAVGTDEARDRTDPYRVGNCLRYQYGWSDADVQNAQVQVSIIEARIRAEHDSIRRTRRHR